MAGQGYPDHPYGNGGGEQYPAQRWGPTSQYPSQAGPPAAPPRRPRSRLPLILTALIAVIALTVGGLYFFGAFSTEVRVEPVAYTDAEAFTGSVGDGVPLPAAALPASTAVSGNQVGLYGGTGQNACDAGQLVTFLEQNPDKGAAWAGVEGIGVSDIRTFVAGLTPVILRSDTAVTNHGFRNGQANAINSVLQAGTAVLVDDRGVPRAKCKCGNPLLEGKQYTRSSYTGQSWSGFDSSKITQVRASAQPITSFSLTNVSTGALYQQKAGSAVGPAAAAGDICPFIDAGTKKPIEAAQGSTFTDSRGKSYRVGNDCGITETKTPTSSRAGAASTTAGAAPTTSAPAAAAPPRATTSAAPAGSGSKSCPIPGGGTVQVGDSFSVGGSNYTMGPGCKPSQS